MTTNTTIITAAAYNGQLPFVKSRNIHLENNRTTLSTNASAGDFGKK